MTPGGSLARLLVTALEGRPSERVWRRAPYVPPSDTPTPGAIGLAPSTRLDLCQQLLRCTLTDESFELVEDWLHADIVVWTPVSYSRGRAELLGSLHEFGSDALTEATVEIVSADMAGSRAFLEWRLAGRFTEPCFIDDDLLVEPTGRLVETAGVLVVSFDGEQVASLHCYFDDLGVLEQLVTMGGRGRPSINGR